MAPQNSRRFNRVTQVEPLEQRIAPAILTANGVRAASNGVINLDADPNTDEPALLTTDVSGGNYLLYVEKGKCQVYVTDYNSNGKVDFNEITGIAAGDGLRLVSFTDIHGDIVTNLKPDFTLTDSDNDSSNGLDGRVILNSTIEKIEMRSIRQTELPTGLTVASRLALSNYSIFGYIYAGKGFGAADGGLIIERNGVGDQATKFAGTSTKDEYFDIPPVIGGIKVGSAVSNQYFTFGIASGPEDRNGDGVIGSGDQGRGHGLSGTNIGGQFIPFVPGPGQPGADIIGFKVVNDQTFVDVGSFVAGNGGNGGPGARGGDIKNFRLPGDASGGYRLVAGNAGYGTTGQRGGNIDNYMDLGSFTGEILLQAGRGGDASLSSGGNGGAVLLSQTGVFGAYARLRILPGDGGNGLTDGGNGGSISSLGVTIPNASGLGLSYATGLVSSMHLAPTVRTLSSTGTTVVSLDPLSPVTTGGIYVGQRVQFTLPDPDGAGPLLASTELRTVTAVDYFGKTVTLNAPVSATPALGGSPLLPVKVKMTFEGDQGIAQTDRAGADATKTGLLRGFDFDGDGFNDAVYASTSDNDLNQLNVLFGRGEVTGPQSGFDLTRTLYLNCGRDSGAVTVNDFNGDGRPDIAAASKQLSSDGIRVYLSQFDPSTGQFLGFSDPLFSPLMGFNEYQEDSPFAPGGDFNNDVNNGSRRILALESGDFDGDGTVDLAVSTEESPVNARSYYLAILRNGDNNGRFAVDLDYGVNPVSRYNVVLTENDVVALKPLIQASSVGTTIAGSGARNIVTDGSFRNLDLLYVAVPGERKLAEVRLLQEGEKIGTFSAEGTLTSRLVLTGGRAFDGQTIEPAEGTIGFVDTNRKIIAGDVDNRSLENATVQDFILRDLNGDSIPDLAFLVADPTGFLVTFIGLPNGTFRVASDPAVNGDQTGIFIGGSGKVALLPTMGPTNVLTVISYEVSDIGDGNVPGVFALDYPIDPVDLYDTAGDQTKLGFVDARVLRASVVGSGESISADSDLVYFDVYDFSSQKSDLRSNLNRDIIFNSPFRDRGGLDQVYGFYNGSLRQASLTNNGVFLEAGDGGRGALGAGGNGGNIGTGILEKTDGISFNGGKGGVNVLLPSNSAYNGTVLFQAGAGGEGGTNGGAGGSIAGVSNAYDPDAGLLSTAVVLRAGDGGRGRSGKGGDGGNLSKFSVTRGVLFEGGDAGDGVNGGKGGSVIGTDLFGISVSQDVSFTARSGRGGRGLMNGGAGGDVNGLAFSLLLTADVDNFQSLALIAGDGGAGLGGTGGAGGSVNDTSISIGSPALRANLTFSAGDGGRGQTGGDGGSVRGFQNYSLGSAMTVFSMVAGDGGTGIRGNGGKGGAVIKTVTTASGDGALGSVGELKNSHVIGGNGGDSVGGIGGAGGSVGGLSVADGVSLSTTRRSMVAAAGRGGDGLRAGGVGGDVRNSVLDSGSHEGSKLLIVAGEGGNASGSEVREKDPLAYGGADAVGGNGGSIYNIKQATVSVSVDLIAGNGGDTLNSGSSASLNSKVGAGGSIFDVKISGDIGRLDVSASIQSAIKSYNNIYAKQRMTDFIRQHVVTDRLAVDDSVGNVGIVVGARGRVRDVSGDESDQPDGIPDGSTGGRNGILRNVSASNIMSAVAGSVDRVESIRFISDVSIKSGGVFGDDKKVDSLGRIKSGDNVEYGLGQLDYLDYDNPNTDTVAGGSKEEDRHSKGLNPRSVVIGGKLVDGAIVGANPRQLRSDRDFFVG